MKLYEIPEGSRIKAETANDTSDFIVFHHVDGMYSYCTVEGKPKEVCHLSASQELTLSEEGYYELA
jgi:hypothetical protein